MAAGSIAPCAPRRLRWQCRRGMLELDRLLLGFLDHGYGALDEHGQALFLTLLDQPDPELSDWFLGRAVPADPALHGLVRQIVAAARTAASGR